MSAEDKRREYAIHKATSLKTLLTSPWYWVLKDAYVDWAAAPDNSADKDKYWKEMEKILKDYGFENLKDEQGGIPLNQFETILEHLFYTLQSGGGSRAW